MTLNIIIQNIFNPVFLVRMFLSKIKQFKLSTLIDKIKNLLKFKKR